MLIMLTWRLQGPVLLRLRAVRLVRPPLVQCPAQHCMCHHVNIITRQLGMLPPCSVYQRPHACTFAWSLLLSGRTAFFDVCSVLCPTI